MTDREKALVVYGYVRRLAEEAKEEGLFKDMTVRELITLMIVNYCTEEGKSDKEN